ncbi:protein AF-9 homolog [Drosophila hydei]|uniref:Protein AF-9 homolog n=1 Tax=Drosophila hydei TaxID=7224 RepID=A0A6J1LB34_DROHY|nr:protein AF-9 homolog [Drosophila hydei]
MSFTNLHSYPVDGYQRVSYCRAESMRRITDDGDNAAGDGIVICKNVILGCKPETADDFRPFVFEPTWCVYIRAEDTVDMGRYVKRVTFRMSPRLPLRLHVADSSPFEITEVLSTDFPLELQVDYVDPTMSPTTYLYKPNDAFDGKYNVDLRMTFQGHERRDKMFFMNPSQATQLTLTTPGPLLTTPAKAKLYSALSRDTEKVTKKQKLIKLATSRTEETSDVVSPFMSPSAPRPIFNVRQTPDKP